MQERLALRRCCAYERAALVWKKWVNSGRLALTGLDQAWPGELIVPVESTHVEISWKAGHFGALNCLMVQTMIETSHFGPKPTKILFFPFSCKELQSVGLLPSMAQVHLLLHAYWCGHLVRLGWVLAKREDNIFNFGQPSVLSPPIIR